ncbi:hypothetical protein, partial [Thiolapillus sp.]|uniref:hypothetical protein n=1 Tax=Thiolapillus sp. TaxID=2017437 RepID=UPI003AF6A9BC
MGKLGWFISKTSTATAPPREGEPAGTTKQGILKTYARNNGHIPFTKHPLPQNKTKLTVFLQRIGVLMRFPTSPKYG